MGCEEMGGGEGSSNGGSTGGVHCWRSGAVNNGFGIRIGIDSCNGFSGPSEGFQTYKRRKRIRSSSESKGQEDGGVSMEAASKLADETSKELPECPDNHASLNGSNDVSHKDYRNFVLEHIYQSLNDEKGGIKGCIRDALLMKFKESGTCDKDRHNGFSQTGWMPNENHYASKGHVDVVSDESFCESHHSVAEMCQQVFLNILLSEKFTLLCKLLFENFQEMKLDNFLNLSVIHVRMKDGVYERSPLLFLEDVQQVWTKLKGIGNELLSLSMSLSDVSMTFYDEQFSTLGNVCSCLKCGGKADGKDCLVCDSCEKMYHVSCIEPAVKEIPSKSWYCASCTAVGIGSPHENCVVCERLNAPTTCCNKDNKMSTKTGKKFSKFEETSNHTRDDFNKLYGCINFCHCRMCGNAVEHGEKIKICDHAKCRFKYYHVRCLSIGLLKSYGPRWYCPSCLCRVCLIDKDDKKIVLCDGCDHGYHMYCMSPPRKSVPRGKWFCKHCDVKIKKIRKAKSMYERRKYEEECENLRKKMDEKFEQEPGTGREGMDILLTAALKFEENSDGIKSK